MKPSRIALAATLVGSLTLVTAGVISGARYWASNSARGPLAAPARLASTDPVGFERSVQTKRPTSRWSAVPVAARGLVSAVLGRDNPQYRLSGLRGRNPAQGFGLAFSPAGASLVAGRARLRLSLAAFGYGGAMRTVASTWPSMTANRVVYTHGGVREWYVNGPLGLEQGFDVASRPRIGGGPLTLAVALSGNVRARLDHGSIILSGSGAQLSYGGLVVTDGRGHMLRSWLAAAPSQILIRVADRGAVYPLQVDPLVQVAELSNTFAASRRDALGYAVGVSGDTIAVGLPGFTSARGAVMVFVRHGFLGWFSATKPTAVLYASDAAPQQCLGFSVGISGDTVVAGAPGCVSGTPGRGAVYVWVRPSSGWSGTVYQAAELTASDPSGGDELGTSVAISGDTAVAGAPEHGLGANAYPGPGAVYAWVKPAGGWTSGYQTAELTASDAGKTDGLGLSVAISGGAVAGGAPYHNSGRGAVYVFVEPTSGWSNATQTAEMTASDAYPGGYLGTALAASGDTLAAAGAYRPSGSVKEDQVYVFVKPSGGWATGTQTAILDRKTDANADDQLGQGVAIAGDTVVAGAPGHQVGTNPDQGEIYQWTKPTSGWINESTATTFAAYDGGWGDDLGWSAAADGSTIVVGAPAQFAGLSSGKAYVFGPIPFWWLVTLFTFERCLAPAPVHHTRRSAGQSCALVEWRAPPSLVPYLAGYNVFRGKRKLNRKLVASETDAFQLKIHGTHKHLRTVPVLGMPPACIAGGPFTNPFDGRLGGGWTEHVPAAGPKFSLKAKPGCLQLTVPKSHVYDSSSAGDKVPELLRSVRSGGWTATTRLTLAQIGKASAGSVPPPGFHTGMVLNLPAGSGPAPTQLYWGLYRAGPRSRISLRLATTGSPNLVDAPGAPKTVDLRITYSPANCAYTFSYEYPGQTVFSDSRYTFNSCAQGAQVGLMTRTFGSPIKVTTDFDWLDIHRSSS